MPSPFPPTSLTLLSQLRASDGATLGWQISWRRFLELYNGPLSAVTNACYRYHTGGLSPSNEVVEDIVADVVWGFFSRGMHGFDPEKGRLRSFLRMIINARVVDVLRKERPVDRAMDTSIELAEAIPPESDEERDAFQISVLATLIEDLRRQIPLRQFEVFELVKLKNRPPIEVAEELGVKRAVVDNTVYKVINKLRELARQPEYQEEFYS